jgi:hypothetical protein
MIPRSSNRPSDLDALAPGTWHHLLDPGSAGSGSRSLDHARSMRRVSGHGWARRPETARPAVCVKAVRAFTPRLGRYGVSPSPSDYLASEYTT